MVRDNRPGVFSNADDTEVGLRAAPAERFAAVAVERHGCVVLFEAGEA